MTMSQPHATSTTLAHQEEPLGVTRLRQDFPALHQQIDGKPLIYLDNASSAHKPRAMIDCIAPVMPTTTPSCARLMPWASASRRPTRRHGRPRRH